MIFHAQMMLSTRDLKNVIILIFKLIAKLFLWNFNEKKLLNISEVK